MDHRIYDQLDMLERGARVETLWPRAPYDNSSAEFSAYDVPESTYREASGFSPGYQPAEDEFAEQPMILDSFGEFQSIPD